MILLDDRRDVVIPGTNEETLKYCTEHFLDALNKGIQERGKGSVALSGGSTPKAIFQMISSPKYKNRIDWTKVLLFWSDERSVPITNPESNYKNAMDAGISSLGVPADQIFRMHAESDIEKNSKKYENEILKNVPGKKFDLVMLGMGDDGHTASLFPFTQGLQVEDALVTENFVPQHNTWRMSLTYKGIQSSRSICIYVLGKSKAERVKEVLTGPYEPERLPSQKVGTPSDKATWILDKEAASLLIL